MKNIFILVFLIFPLNISAALLPPKPSELQSHPTKKQTPPPNPSPQTTQQAKAPPSGVIVVMTDFGLTDGAVSSMKGVMTSVNRNLRIFDLTHEIPPYNIWEASYRWYQVVPYWIPGTVFVSIVDPGVGGDHIPVVAKAKNGSYFVTPNNGTLTLVNDTVGIEEIRAISQENRLQNSNQSYTFYGRDVYALTAARLAAGRITFEQVGEVLPLNQLIKLDYIPASIKNGLITGTIPVLDKRYGNVWSNIPLDIFLQLTPNIGDKFAIKIFNGDDLVYEAELPYLNTFYDAPEKTGLIYMNSLLEVSLALNMDNFAETYNIGSGPDWKIEISKSN